MQAVNPVAGTWCQFWITEIRSVRYACDMSIESYIGLRSWVIRSMLHEPCRAAFDLSLISAQFAGSSVDLDGRIAGRDRTGRRHL